MYTPDYWKIVKITSGATTTYKLLAHFIGGYTTGSSWRLNSGITNIVFDNTNNTYQVHGASGSTYLCRATNEYVSGYMLSILDRFLYSAKNKDQEPNIEVINLEDYQNENRHCQ